MRSPGCHSISVVSLRDFIEDHRLISVVKVKRCNTLQSSARNFSQQVVIIRYWIFVDIHCLADRDLIACCNRRRSSSFSILVHIARGTGRDL